MLTVAPASLAAPGMVDFTPEGVRRLRLADRLASQQYMSIGGQHNVVQKYATLSDDAWRQLDRNILTIAPRVMSVVQDLVANGLTIATQDVGISVGGYEAMGDIDPARMSMSMSASGRNQQASVNPHLMPLPFVYDDMQFDLRTLMAMARGGVDLAHIALAQQKVLEGFEQLAVNGSTQFAYQSVPIYGMLNHPRRLTLTATGTWATAANIYPTIHQAFSLLVGQQSIGPFALYLSLLDWAKMFAEQGVDVFSTVMKRVRDTFADTQAPLITAIKPSFAIPTGQAALVELTARTVQLWVVMAPTNIPWERMGGLEAHVRTMGSMTAFWKQTGETTPVCRVVHISGI